MTIETVTPGSGDALILVDVQNDFLPGDGKRAVASMHRHGAHPLTLTSLTGSAGA